MANLDETKFYDLVHLKRDSERLAANLERIQDMYIRMSSILAKHVNDDQSIENLLRINRNIKKMKSLITEFNKYASHSIGLEEQFPWE